MEEALHSSLQVRGPQLGYIRQSFDLKRYVLGSGPKATNLRTSYEANYLFCRQHLLPLLAEPPFQLEWDISAGGSKIRSTAPRHLNFLI